jgi:polyisoprenoid-binding protein YceI
LPKQKTIIMKKTVLGLLLALSMTSFVSCKDEAATPTSDAIEASAASDKAIAYKIDLENSIVDWKGSKPTEFHTGTINLSAGEALIADGKLESGKFTLDMTSITVTDLKSGDGKEVLEGHLKGTGDKAKEDHFFNVGTYPTGEFEITNVSEENGKKMITGNLTMKDVSKSITFPATITNNETSLTIKSEPFLIDRTLWNVNYASKTVFDDLKDKFVDDNIELVVNVKIKK